MMNLVDASVIQHVIASTAPPAAPAPPAYAPPPPAPPTVDPQKVSLLFGVSDQQAALIQQVMSLTDAQIGALPPDQRAQIVALRQQIMSGQM